MAPPEGDVASPPWGWFPSLSERERSSMVDQAPASLTLVRRVMPAKTKRTIQAMHRRRHQRRSLNIGDADTLAGPQKDLAAAVLFLLGPRRGGETELTCPPPRRSIIAMTFQKAFWGLACLTN